MVRNLFPLRATKPKVLLTASEPSGGDRGNAEIATARTADLVVAAWGAIRPGSGLDVRAQAERVRTVMIAREVRGNAMDGRSPRLVVVAAKNNLAVRLPELDEEVLTELARLQGELWRNIDRPPGI